jgi:L-tartrate/succinate antiporter
VSDSTPSSTSKLAAPLVVWLAIILISPPAGLSANGWRYLGLFSGVIVALVLEPLPPAAVGLIGVSAAVVLGDVVPNPADAIKWGLSGFSDSTVWLIFGALILSTGYEKTGLGRRIALVLVKRMGRSTLGLDYAVMLADLALAPFTATNTGRSAGVIYPIVRSIPPLYGSAPGPTARRMGAYLMWTAFAATSITSSMFLTALSPNLLAVGLLRKEAGLDVTWTQWSMGFLPVGLLLIAILPLLTYIIYPPEIRSSPDVPAWAANELVRLGRFSRREGALGVLILVAFSLWVFGGEWINATTAILAVVSLLVIFRVLDWEEVAGNRSAWDTVFYFATLMTLADGLNRVGVVSWVARGVSSHLAGVSTTMAIIGFVVFFFVVHYAFASLTAHTAVVFPALLAAGASYPGMPVRIFAMVMAYSIGLMGVLTPYATGPAPVYFGSGFIPRKDFWILGSLFGLIFLSALLGLGLPYLHMYYP